MERVAIGYLAAGERARCLCRLSIASLRMRGWDGPVKVLSDRDFPAGSGVEVAQIPAHMLNIDRDETRVGYEVDIRDFDATRPPGDAIKQLTPMMPRFFDLRDVDLMVQMDVDILAARSVPDCVARMAATGRDFGVALNAAPRMTKRSASAGNLSRWERMRWRNAPHINSGLFFFRPNLNGMAVLRAWQAELARRIRGDQAALQAVILRRFRDQVAYLDETYQAFPPMPLRYDRNPSSLHPVSADFAHFRGATQDPVVLRDYAARFEAVPPEVLREVLAAWPPPEVS